jgi:undecaprenyl diphosphate synthase
MKPDAQANAKLPVHVAIIMDGNGRWAKARGLPRNAGHRQGAENVRTIVRAARDLGIRFITLYAFSAENWDRPKEEVDELMRLLERFLDSQAKEIQKQQLRFLTIGDIAALPQGVQERIEKVRKESAANENGTLVLALNYGSRQEIVAAAKAYAADVQAGRENPDALDWAKLSKYLYTRDIPDPDLVIRTSGEERISNFLLLQGAYAEYYFSPKNWPEFGKADLKAALDEYATRERRFGKTGEQLENAAASPTKGTAQ